ncbi:MAG: hypothetical protein BWX65_00243 [Bacteroidetes bacterium ADurb.Bin057]|jgi:hypothetical protein|nr:MAG: hypothetical protein BWX65_00243 [Bacteroidetes bacterium ADurb.Bin057]
MQNKRLKLGAVLLLGLGLTGLQAQTSVNAAGGKATGGGGTVAYSVGQVVYTSNKGSGGTIDQGVQHAYEIFPVGIKETTLNLSLTLFPNPTTESLILQINDNHNDKLSYQLFDMQGQELSKGDIVGQQTLINMSSLPTATYFLNVVDQENKKVQSFKIIKN